MELPTWWGVTTHPVFGAARARRRPSRGIILISAYLMLFLLLVYGSSVSLLTVSQRVATRQLVERHQALDLAQGATEQLREDLYQFLTADVYALRYQNDVVTALKWLDKLGEQTGQSSSASTKKAALDPPFLLPNNAANGTSGEGLSLATPRTITLPSGSGKAWLSAISSANPLDPLAPREITMTAEATVGTVTERVQSTHRIMLGASDIFRHAYFVNNYGWFRAGRDARLTIYGEVRANGDLDFASPTLTAGGETGNILVNGDLYAANNPSMVNPSTNQTARGLISGNPTQTASWLDYWKTKPLPARPARRLVALTQPALGGAPRLLPYGFGWDSDHPEQTRYQREPVKPIPYLGDLTLYKELAKGYRDGAGASLTYYDGSVKKTIQTAYKGPDGIADSPDDKVPLVLIGTASRPIELSGPVVVPGDVIIRGVVTGRGTIYAGRNIHVVGSVTYQNPPSWIALERNELTGQIREANVSSGPTANLGVVSAHGKYAPPPSKKPAQTPRSK